MDIPSGPAMHHFQGAPMQMVQIDSFAPAPPRQQQTMSQHHLLPSQLSHTDATDRARAYKSRNKRPCDFCRYKKAACHLDTHPPCELCIRYNKECTFVESPAKRRRPNDSENGQSRSGSSSIYAYSNHERNSSIGSQGAYGGGAGNGMAMDMQRHGMMHWDNGIAPFVLPIPLEDDIHGGDFPLDPAFYHHPDMAYDPFPPLSATANVQPMESKLPSLHPPSSVDTNPSPRSAVSQIPPHSAAPMDATCAEPSLDMQTSSNAQIVGMSGECDPYLLSRYRYDAYNEAHFHSIRIRKMYDGLGNTNRIPTFFAIQHNSLASKAQPPEKAETLGRYRREVEDMVSDDVGRRLIRLFYRFIQPYLPMLGRESDCHPRGEDGTREPSSVPTCLLAAIYGHALAFCPWDDKLCVEVYTPPSADALFQIAWLSCVADFHTPSLATLQTLLLLVQRRPTNKHVSDTPFKGVIMAATISIAQSLGLHRDPSNWPLPMWEIKQRKRLAWAIFIQDKWLALNSGKSSLLRSDDWDVDPLTVNDFAEIDRHPDGPDGLSDMCCQHFMKLCELTQIADDILRNLFSIRATKALHDRLEATLEVAKPLRLRLTEWYQSLPMGLLPRFPLQQQQQMSPGNTRQPGHVYVLDGNGSLHLAYITAKIELFRAMLRPRVTDSNATALSALRTGAMAVAREVFDFLDGLDAPELEAFWASYSRTNFTIASSFMLLLYVTSPNLPDAKECLTLLTAWRSLLRLKSRSCDLLGLALLRLDGVWVAGIDRLIELSPPAAQAWKESGQGQG